MQRYCLHAIRFKKLESKTPKPQHGEVLLLWRAGPESCFLSYLVSLLVTCSSFLKCLEGKVWIHVLLKSIKIFPLTVYGF